MYNFFEVLNKMSCENCKGCIKSKHRTDEEKHKLKKRINTLEGQVRGIGQMIEDDRYCNDVLIQISAINNSLKSLANTILKSHMNSCMIQEIQSGNIEIVDDIMELFKRVN